MSNKSNSDSISFAARGSRAHAYIVKVFATNNNSNNNNDDGNNRLDRMWEFLARGGE